MVDALNIATAPRCGTLHWKQTTITWDDFTKKFREPKVVDDKYACGGYVLGLLKETINRNPRADHPGGCVALHRNKEAVVSRSALTLDADKPQPGFLNDLSGLLEGVAYVVHTTHSSTPDAPRYRVVIPLDRAATPAESRLLSDYVMRQVGIENWDQSCAEPERLMFWPATPDPAHYWHDEGKGGPLEVQAWLLDAGMVDDAVPVATDTPAPESTREPLPAAMVEDAVQQAIRELLALAELGPGQKDDKGRGWDDGLVVIACDLVRAANSGFGLEAAYRVFVEYAPTDQHFTETLRDDKWEWAVDRVGADRLSDFDALPEDDAATRDLAPPLDRFDADVERELHRLRVQQTAREKLARERLAGSVVPPVRPLVELLDEPDEEALYRVDGLWPLDGRVVLAAAQKAGKTTLVGNLTRSLVDGEPFLNRFEVQPVRRVVIVDNELSPRTLRLWLREQGIQNVGAVDVVTLRGHLSSFNLLDPVIRGEWAARLGPADVLVFDCLRPMLDALGLSEDKDAGKVLEALDELTAEAGIRELFLVHHMGHNNERTRGDSRILDWPDAVWKVVREDADVEHSPRFFRAHGRDVDQREVRLGFDSDTRHLYIDGESRAVERLRDLDSDILDLVRDNPGSGQNDIEKGVTGRREDVRAGIRRLVESGQLRVTKQGQKRLHFISLDEFDDAR